MPAVRRGRVDLARPAEFGRDPASRRRGIRLDDAGERRAARPRQHLDPRRARTSTRPRLRARGAAGGDPHRSSRRAPDRRRSRRGGPLPNSRRSAAAGADGVGLRARPNAARRRRRDARETGLGHHTDALARRERRGDRSAPLATIACARSSSSARHLGAEQVAHRVVAEPRAVGVAHADRADQHRAAAARQVVAQRGGLVARRARAAPRARSRRPRRDRGRAATSTSRTERPGAPPARVRTRCAQRRADRLIRRRAAARRRRADRARRAARGGTGPTTALIIWIESSAPAPSSAIATLHTSGAIEHALGEVHAGASGSPSALGVRRLAGAAAIAVEVDRLGAALLGLRTPLVAQLERRVREHRQEDRGDRRDQDDGREIGDDVHAQMRPIRSSLPQSMRSLNSSSKVAKSLATSIVRAKKAR